MSKYEELIATLNNEASQRPLNEIETGILDSKQQVAILQADLKSIQETLGVKHNQATELAASLGKAEADNKHLKEYVQHKNNCKYIEGLRGNSIEDCDCGLEQALSTGGGRKDSAEIQQGGEPPILKG